MYVVYNFEVNLKQIGSYSPHHVHLDNESLAIWLGLGPLPCTHFSFTITIGYTLPQGNEMKLASQQRNETLTTIFKNDLIALCLFFSKNLESYNIQMSL